MKKVLIKKTETQSWRTDFRKWLNLSLRFVACLIISGILFVIHVKLNNVYSNPPAGPGLFFFYLFFLFPSQFLKFVFIYFIYFLISKNLFRKNKIKLSHLLFLVPLSLLYLFLIQILFGDLNVNFNNFSLKNFLTQINVFYFYFSLISVIQITIGEGLLW